MAHPLERYRKSKGLSQQELAEKLSCTQGMIGHIERGFRKVRPEKAIKWERKHGIPRAIFRPDLWPLDTELAA